MIVIRIKNGRIGEKIIRRISLELIMNILWHRNSTELVRMTGIDSMINDYSILTNDNTNFSVLNKLDYNKEKEN